MQLDRVLSQLAEMPGDGSIRLSENLGKAFYYDDQLALAIQTWQGPNSAQPARLAATTRYFLGWAYAKQGNPSGAASAWKGAGVPVSHFTTLLSTARSAGASQAEMLSLVEAVISFAPDDPQIWLAVAREYESQGQAKLAASAWDRVVVLTSSSAPLHWLAQGGSFRVQGQIDKAVQAYVIGTQLDPTSRALWSTEARALANCGQWTRAAEVAEQWALALPNDPEAYYLAGESHYVLKQYDEAERWFKHAIMVDRTASRSYHRLGNIAMLRGQPAIAATYFESAVAADPAHPYVAYTYSELSNAYRSMENLPAATHSLKRAIAALPQQCRQDWWALLGSMYREMGKVQDAIAAYESALACDPGFSEGKRILQELRTLRR